MSKHVSTLKRAAILLGVVTMATILMVSGALGQNSGNQYTIGVLPFVDNSGSGGQDLPAALARTVQSDITQSTKLEGRVLNLGAGTNPSAVDAAKAVEIGRSNNVDVVLVGTVLEASSEESSKGGSGPSFGGFHVGATVRTVKAKVALRGDLYSTATGKQIDSISVTGNSSQSKVGSDISTSLGDLSTDANSFSKSPIGKALHEAVTELVKKVSDDQSQMTRYTGGAGSNSMAASASQPGSPAGAAGGEASAGANPSNASGAAAGAQPELKAAKIDFIPGERTIFYDDFSDMAEDEPPPHWKVRGGTVELRTGGGIRELYAAEGVQLTSSSFVLPKNFTLQLVWTGGGEMDWSFQDKDGDNVLVAMVRGEEDGKSASTTVSTQAGGELGSGTINADTSQPTEFALWVQQGRVRAYLNGQRVVDANQVDLGPIDRLFVDDSRFRPNGIRSVRVAESAPDFSTMIASTGKYVTHGIYFDTDSATLKPESAAVIKSVASGLEKNPNLKLEIDGYTDSVGDASHNLDLSKRRAEAVRSVLVSQFGIDASRLTAGGFGADKPIGSNDTAEGRAQNRRVEFVKK